jgi:hypothetical protein
MSAVILMPNFAQRGAPPGAAEVVRAVAEAVRRAIVRGGGYTAILDAARATNLAAEFPLLDHLVIAIVDAGIAAGRQGGGR